jgi:hypothetical protein
MPEPRRYPPPWSVQKLDACGTVADLQRKNKNCVDLLIGLCAHTIRDNDPEIKSWGVTVSKYDAGYQPVAWWFTKRRLGQDLRSFYQGVEELPAQLLALVAKLEGKSDSSLVAEGEECVRR